MVSKRALPLRRKNSGHKVVLTSGQIDQIPINDRILVIGLWHALNELNVLRKLIITSSNTRTLGEIEAAAQATQSLTLIKLFAMKAFSAWEFFCRAQVFPEFKARYVKSQLAEIENPKNVLGKFFGKKSMLERVRNNLAAHYKYETIKTACETGSKSDTFIYMPDHQGNALYYAAEEIVAQAFSDLSGASLEVGPAWTQLLDEMDLVTDNLTDLVQNITIVTVEHFIGRDQILNAEISVVRAIDSQRLESPYFVDYSSAVRRVRDAAVTAP